MKIASILRQIHGIFQMGNEIGGRRAGYERRTLDHPMRYGLLHAFDSRQRVHDYRNYAKKAFYFNADSIISAADSSPSLS